MATKDSQTPRTIISSWNRLKLSSHIHAAIINKLCASLNVSETCVNKGVRVLYRQLIQVIDLETTESTIKHTDGLNTLYSTDIVETNYRSTWITNPSKMVVNKDSVCKHYSVNNVLL